MPMGGQDWADGLSVEALHQEADSIQQWLASHAGDGKRRRSPQDVAGTLANLEGQLARLKQQLSVRSEESLRGSAEAPAAAGAASASVRSRRPTLAEARAQQDILQLLQGTAESLEAGMPEATSPAIEAPHLEQLHAQLQDLRGRYIEMLGRCEEFRDQLCASQAKKEAQRTAGDQKRRSWEKLVAEHQLLVDQGEAEIERLRHEVEEAQGRQEKVQQERERLERAARQDQATLKQLQLRLKLRQVEARRARPG
ncbi:unnamed protein product [Cladocopium goreaui]|uniref:Voltage-dependent L-type calcium channel subunit alpha-1C n=1 Tax=Cladocopium goreaui TaxID=2562237 RepID=A0A9P1GBF8_9DINO|nr:unnamed protein product [Cladocopium goreaui]